MKRLLVLCCFISSMFATNSYAQAMELPLITSSAITELSEINVEEPPVIFQEVVKDVSISSELLERHDGKRNRLGYSFTFIGESTYTLSVYIEDENRDRWVYHQHNYYQPGTKAECSADFIVDFSKSDSYTLILMFDETELELGTIYEPKAEISEELPVKALIDDESEFRFQNPVGSGARFSIVSNRTDIHTKVFDTQGRLITISNDSDVQLPYIVPGVYLLHIFGGEEVLKKAQLVVR